MYHAEIHIKGKINPCWADWFEGLAIEDLSTDETVLAGTLPDMAALYGVLSRLGSLVFPLISVNCRRINSI